MDPNSICRKSRRLAGKQREICRKEIEIVEEVANGAKIALSECQYQFKQRRWNCTTTRRSLDRVIRKGELNDRWFGLGLWSLTPLSTVFQLYRGGQFYWWKKQ
jgi:hypothetical protein